MFQKRKRISYVAKGQLTSLVLCSNGVVLSLISEKNKHAYTSQINTTIHFIHAFTS